MQSNYFACQFIVPGGYRLSKLKLIEKKELDSIRKIQYRPIDITENEFKLISENWNTTCKIKSNWEMEKWMNLLNCYIKKFRSRNNFVDKIKPIITLNPIEPIENVQIQQVLKPIKPIEPIEPITIEDQKINNSEIITKEDSNGNLIEYKLVTDKTDVNYIAINKLLNECLSFITKRYEELKKELNFEAELEIDLYLKSFNDSN
jgi:hypothetical protein